MNFFPNLFCAFGLIDLLIVEYLFFMINFPLQGFMCAIKYLYKKKLIMKKTLKMPFEERDMLLKFDNPFIVCLSYTFQTEEKLCFVLDLMNGRSTRKKSFKFISIYGRT